MFVLSRYFLIQIVFKDLLNEKKINHFKPTIAILVDYVSFNLVRFPIP